MTSTMLATAGRVVHRLMQQNGLDADALFLEVGLDPVLLDEPLARYPLPRVIELWFLADRRIATPCWGMEGGRLWHPTDFHALGYAFMASSTLESALRRLERFFRVVALDLLVGISTTPDTFTLSFRLPMALPDPPAMQDARLSTLYRMCQEISGGKLQLREVRFAHPDRGCDYEDFFGCPVRFEAEVTSLSFPRDELRRPLPARNRELAWQNDKVLMEVERTLNDAHFTDQVRKAILHCLPNGRPSSKVVASSLAVSQRSLQRKLREEGATYQSLLDELLMELSMQYMRAGDQSLETIAYLTGFANPPAFSRAYKRWTGRSPSQDRGRRG